MLLSILSCNIINPDEQEPAYLRIDSITVDPTFSAHGSTSSNIKDAWVFVDDEMVGIFELPATIPVLASGPRKLLIGPGIQVSGSSLLRDNYLFYNAYESVFDFVPGEIKELQPTVTYRAEDNSYSYITVENFESIFTGLTASPSSDAELVVDSGDDVFEGDASGSITITEDMDFVQIQTASAYELPINGKIIYMELDYKTDVEFTIGVFINNNAFNDQTIDYTTLRSTNGEWNKVYLALTALLGNAINPDNFIFYFRPNIPAGGSSGRVQLDNVKLMIQK